MSAFVLETVSSTTPIPPMRADWTPLGMYQWLDRAPRAQRDRRLVAPPRRVRQPLTECDAGHTWLGAAASFLAMWS